MIPLMSTATWRGPCLLSNARMRVITSPARVPSLTMQSAASRALPSAAAIGFEDVEQLGRPAHLPGRRLQGPARCVAEFLALREQRFAAPQFLLRGLALDDLDL